MPVGAAVASLGVAALFGAVPDTRAAAGTAVDVPEARAESVVHEWTVTDDFVSGRATIRWEATKGRVLTLFQEPGVLLRCAYPTNVARLAAVTRNGRREPDVVFALEVTFALEVVFALEAVFEFEVVFEVLGMSVAMLPLLRTSTRASSALAC